MRASTATRRRAARTKDPEPAWDIARLFPAQGCWTEEDYLTLDTNLRVEYADGSVEVHEMPTQQHQLIIAFLYRRLAEFATAHGLGIAMFAGIRVRLWPGKYREPDIVFMHRSHEDRRSEQYWDGADLVMEVISVNRERDLVTKRHEYARARIPEYWIVDPRDRRITVLRLEDGDYVLHGAFEPGSTASSALFPAFAVAVEDVFTVLG